MALRPADFILIIHVLFILGVVLPVPLILLGGLRRWAWVRNPWFRLAHLAMIGIVVAESLLHIPCPLTVWENSLRVQAGEAGSGDAFIEHWLHRFFFFQAPHWVFTAAYAAFGLLVLALLCAYPPKWRRVH